MAIKGAYIMDKVTIPSVIVECGFMSNPGDLSKLKNDEYQDKLVKSIVKGLIKYY